MGNELIEEIHLVNNHSKGTRKVFVTRMRGELKSELDQLRAEVASIMKFVIMIEILRIILCTHIFFHFLPMHIFRLFQSRDS